MYNLASVLEDAASTFPDRIAVVLGESRLTYAEVDRRASQVAAVLAARGIGRGDKVALTAPNIPAVCYFGILKAGATVVPLNVLLKSREVAYHLEESEAVGYLCFEGTAELPMGQAGFDGFTQVSGCKEFLLITAEPAAPSSIAGAVTLDDALDTELDGFATVQTDEDDTAVILFTSGTTGRSKGAELRHRNMRDNAKATETLFRNDSERPDTYLGVLPLFHSFGQTVCQNGAFAAGGTLVLLPRFEAAAALRLMEYEQVTFFAGVPTMYWGLLAAAEQDPAVNPAAVAEKLRVAVAGGASLPVGLHRKFEERFGVTILEGYGLSETSPVASFSHYGEPARPGSIGTPIPGVEMKLISHDGDDVTGPDVVGEIAIRGHNVMKGYYQRPGATAEVLDQEGWFRSGDLARRDAEGWYYIVDRAKDLIIRGGFNVYPREVEEVLMTHPDVSLAAVVGVAHPTHGEEVKAYVITRPDATLTPGQLIEWAKTEMASFKYPRQVDFVDAFPMTATGKILKRDLA